MIALAGMLERSNRNKPRRFELLFAQTWKSSSVPKLRSGWIRLIYVSSEGSKPVTRAGSLQIRGIVVGVMVGDPVTVGVRDKVGETVRVWVGEGV